MFQGILIIVAFLVIAVLMALKKLPALLSLPILAIVIAFISGFPLKGEEGIIDLVLVQGTTYLHGTMLLILLACWLSNIMSKTGVTQTIIKKAAELGGDKPLVVSLLLLAVTAFLFTTLFGTGAAMLVSGIVLPLMISVGVPPIAAVNLFLMAFGIGYSLNVSNMSAVTEVAGISFMDLRSTAILLSVGAALFIVVYLFLIFRKGSKRVAFAVPVEEDDITELSEEKYVKGLRGFLAALTPLLIVLLTLVFEINPLACFYIGIVWLMIMTFSGKANDYLNMVVSSFHQAGKDAAAPIGLCIGIGMALKAVMSPATQEAIAPFINSIIPGSAWALVVLLVILSPLVLYRGPLNAWGLGAGIMPTIIALGTFSPVLIGGLFYALVRWANDGCPTSTVVVYASNFVGSDSVTVTNKLFFARWALTAATIIAAAIILR